MGGYNIYLATFITILKGQYESVSYEYGRYLIICLRYIIMIISPLFHRQKSEKKKKRLRFVSAWTSQEVFPLSISRRKNSIHKN